MMTFITGGTRSGKSAYAEALADGYDRVHYLATARIDRSDRDMLRRIEQHRDRRPTHWTTVERSTDLAPVFKQLATENGCVLVESVGTFVLNAMMDASLDWDAAKRAQRDAFEERVLADAESWLDALRGGTIDAIFVSEEVGLCLVSPNAMGRAFSDTLGRLNQRLAAAADHATLVVSGIGLVLK